MTHPKPSRRTARWPFWYGLSKPEYNRHYQRLLGLRRKAERIRNNARP